MAESARAEIMNKAYKACIVFMSNIALKSLNFEQKRLFRVVEKNTKLYIKSKADKAFLNI